MICKKCGIDKDQSEYQLYEYKGREYRRKECITCFKIGRKNYYMNNTEKFKEAKIRCNLKKGVVKKRLPKEVYLTGNDIDSFIKKIKRQAGYADVVDVYRLTHIYTFIYGIKFHENVSVEDQLILMWEELKDYKSPI